MPDSLPAALAHAWSDAPSLRWAVLLLVALLGLVLVGTLLGRARARLALEQARGAAAVELTALREQLAAERERAETHALRASQEAERLQTLSAALAELRAERATLAERAARLPGLEQALAQSQATLGEHRGRLASLETELADERRQGAEKLALLQGARAELTDQFKVLAQEILEDKSRRFTELSQVRLGALLGPLGEQLQAFGRQVQEAYGQESRERFHLKQELERLAGLNTRLSDEALALTRALQGESKTQGAWGELVLERVLEAAGLRRDQDYVAQGALTREDGGRAQPDVVVHLPEGRHLVIDAKVSLTAYARHRAAEDEAARAAALREHLQSLRQHLRGLAARDYPALPGLRSPDFVLMFVPIEPAFSLAVTHDPALLTDALGQNVALVSPSTLLATLRVVAELWRTEQRNRHAQAIAEAGGRLHDKFVAFTESLLLVGQRLDQAQQAHEAALRQLSTGRGNLLRQAEQLRELGVKSSRRPPEALRGEEADVPTSREEGKDVDLGED